MATSIDELLKKGGGSNEDDNMVDSILQELNQTKSDQLQKSGNDEMRIQAMQNQAAQQQMNEQLRVQQSQLQQLIQQNNMKDQVIEQMKNEFENNNNINKESEVSTSNTADLWIEFKSTIFVFIVVLILTLPILNTFITTSIGIENNTIYTILRTFIISIIFFIMNKFI